MKPTTKLIDGVSSFAIFSLISLTTSLDAQSSDADAFQEAIRPISNPAFFDLPTTQTYIHPIFIHQTLPDRIDSTLGKLNLGGDFQIYALALEYAFNEEWALVASKDGYIDFNPDATLTEQEGFADIAAGVKWAFLLKPEEQLAMSAKLMIELPTGNDDVWQGNGSGTAIPSITALKIYDKWQFAGTLGFMVPFDQDEESTMMYHSWHVSYAASPKLFPLIELNHYRVLESGDGVPLFNTQAGGAVPAVIEFEGGDLINLGAANGDTNKDLVTLTFGVRGRITDALDCGVAYEFPLTDEEQSLMENRVTVDLIWRF